MNLQTKKDFTEPLAAIQELKPYTFNVVKRNFFGAACGYKILFEGAVVRIIEAMSFEDVTTIVALLNIAYQLGRTDEMVMRS